MPAIKNCMETNFSNRGNRRNHLLIVQYNTSQLTPKEGWETLTAVMLANMASRDKIRGTRPNIWPRLDAPFGRLECLLDLGLYFFAVDLATYLPTYFPGPIIRVWCSPYNTNFFSAFRIKYWEIHMAINWIDRIPGDSETLYCDLLFPNCCIEE